MGREEECIKERKVREIKSLIIRIFQNILKNWESTVNENQKRIEIFESFLKLCNSILNTIQLLF